MKFNFEKAKKIATKAAIGAGVIGVSVGSLEGQEIKTDFNEKEVNKTETTATVKDNADNVQDLNLKIKKLKEEEINVNKKITELENNLEKNSYEKSISYLIDELEKIYQEERRLRINEEKENDYNLKMQELEKKENDLGVKIIELDELNKNLPESNEKKIIRELYEEKIKITNEIEKLEEIKIKIEPEELQKEIESYYDVTYIKQKSLRYEDYGMFMACNIVIEKPTEYQIKKIKEMQDKIISALETKKFDKISQIIYFINNLIDKNENNSETINIKDAFSEKEDATPIGSFDCDSRSVFCLSILDRLGLHESVTMCLTKGHAFLKINAENTFFETTTNEIINLNEIQNIEIDEIDSFNKYYAYLLGKRATEIITDADINIGTKKPVNDFKMSIGIEMLKKAIELDKNNLTNNFNLNYALKKTDNPNQHKKIASEIINNIKEVMINNFYGIKNDEFNNKNLIITPEEISIGKISPRKIEDLGDPKILTIKAMKESNYIHGELYLLGIDLFYKFEDYDKSLELFQNLSESAQFNTEAYTYSKKMVAQCYFKMKKYDEYIKEVRQNDPENIETISNVLAIEIITGKIQINKSTISDFCNKYKNNPLIGPYINEENDENRNWNVKFIDSNELLRKWSGYNNMLFLIKEFNNNNNNK